VVFLAAEAVLIEFLKKVGLVLRGLEQKPAWIVVNNLNYGDFCPGNMPSGSVGLG